LERLIRAFTPWPGTFSLWNGQPLKVLAAQAAPGHAEPGRVIRHGDGAAVGTREGLLALKEIQLAGRKAMSASEFIRGQADFVGATLTT
jgi:methionyl-tRNA formyltransferase